MDCSLELDPSNVCRVCLEPQENPLSIFTKHIIEGSIRTLPEIILSCFQVDVTSNPNLPKHICESCKSSIIQFFKFKENVVRTEKLLTDIFKTDNEVVLKEEDFDVEEHLSDAAPDNTSVDIEAEPETVVEYEDQYVEEIQLDNVSNEPEFKILDVGEDSQFKTQDEEEEVYELENATSPGKQEEEDDNENELTNMEFIDDATTTFGEFNDETYLEEAEQSNDETTVIIQKEVDENSYEEEPAPKKRRYRKANKDGEQKSTLTLMCKICNKRIQSDDENHDQLHDYYAMIVAAESVLQCFRCSHVFICADELKSHLLDFHYENNEEDEDVFNDLQLLDEDTKQAFWVCGSCNADFASISDLKMHMVTHMTKLGCPVDECGFEYSNFHYFYQHIKRNHLSTKLLSCKYCGKEDVPDFRSLQNHYRQECSAKMYKCEFCSRTFFTDKSWKTHVEIRHIEKKFVCELCGKSFAQITELKIHTRMHTGERPFECTICKKAYKTASGRAAHMDSHSNNVFPCDICGKQMNSRRNLVTHIRRHTEEKRLKCEVCGKRFFTKYHLNLHASKLHNKS
ncbi:zinc finger protein 3 homolog [Episyrphus balteatus]|uniref:zinc finger protein 3 homolog n=1 Tax=Episyrphus balteatus TaxID=286459 RepID=UPI00248594B5|nr:zinc finger protein 3 homolog [Episyrphus balteatus]